MPRAIVEPKLDIWATYHTVGPEGYVDFDGDPAIRPTAEEAANIANYPDQVTHIAWMDFTLWVNDGKSEDERYKLGESFIATSQWRLREVRFRPVSSILEEGRLTKHTAKWLGYLVVGNHESVPDHFEELADLLQLTTMLKA